jgi:uncharacterized membrane protein
MGFLVYVVISFLAVIFSWLIFELIKAAMKEFGVQNIIAFWSVVALIAGILYWYNEAPTAAHKIPNKNTTQVER